MRAALTALALGVLMLWPLPSQAEQTSRFAVYYTDALPMEAFARYDLLVLDSHAHPALEQLRTQGKTLLGYLSLVEVAEYRPYFAELKARRLLLEPLPGKDNVSVIDIRSSEWTAYVIETLIPQLIREGFDGAMLDTADTAIHLEEQDPKRYAGFTVALTRLIRSVRLHYPDFKLMLNRGFKILPDVAADLDMALAESIYTTLDADGTPVLQPEAHYRSVAQMLNGLKAKHASLSLYSLDYWPIDDREGVKAVYAAQRAAGFVPYVSTPDLQRLPEEPE